MMEHGFCPKQAHQYGFCMGNYIAKYIGHAVTGWLAFLFPGNQKLLNSFF